MNTTSWPSAQKLPLSNHISQNDIPLQENPRFSTETQRVNGFRQSVLPDQGDRILEDIRNGNCTCSICLEPIFIGRTREFGIWNCRDCHNVWHFRCMESWGKASNSGVSPLGFALWKCPTCKAGHAAASEPLCWCGKRTLAAGVGLNGTANSCDYECHKPALCRHEIWGLCNRICHPGMCTIHCVPVCEDLRAETRAPGVWARAVNRLKGRRPGTFRQAGLSFATLACIYICLGVFSHLHIRWWTMPYIYTDFRSSLSTAEGVAVVFAMTFFICPTVLCLCCHLWDTSLNILCLFFGMDDTAVPHNSISGQSNFIRKNFLYLAMMIVFLAGFSLPIISIAAGPNIAWHYQMKDSCDGYSTRIKFGNNTMFNLTSLTPGVQTKTFYLGSRIEPKFGHSKRFQYYHRLSGQLQNETYVAVDVDTENNLWRVLELSRNDDANQWQGHDYALPRPKYATSLFRPLPNFSPLAQYEVMSGSIGSFNETQKHMFLPELDLVVQDMHSFIYGCELDPFVRVFNTRGIADRHWDLSDVLKETWNGKGKKDKRYPAIEMRTASFGRGMQDVTICAKEGFESTDRGSSFDGIKWRQDNSQLPRKEGIREDLLVPLTILASFRDRATKNDLRRSTKWCS